VTDGAPFQCADAHRSCEDAGDDKKDEEVFEIETPQRCAPKAACAAILADLFTSAAFSSASMPVTPPTVRKQHVVTGTHSELAEAKACIRRIKRNLTNQRISAQHMIHAIDKIAQMSATPLASTRLHELRLKSSSLRGSYGASQSAAGVAAALAYFEGFEAILRNIMIHMLGTDLYVRDCSHGQRSRFDRTSEFVRV